MKKEMRSRFVHCATIGHQKHIILCCVLCGELILV